MLTIFRYVSPTYLVLAVLLAAIVAVVAMIPALRRRDGPAAARSAARVLLAGAVAAVFAVTLVGGLGGGGVNLVPGAGIYSSLHNVDPALGWLNVLGNVIMLAPVGVLLPLATGCHWRRTTLTAALVSFLVELAQLFLGRSFDVDDVLLNSCGAALGALLGVYLQPLLHRGPSLSSEVPS